MSVDRNGWFEGGERERQVNFINDIYFGLRVNKFVDGNLNYIGLNINHYKFGWNDYYYIDGSIDTHWSGFYLGDNKI